MTHKVTPEIPKIGSKKQKIFGIIAIASNDLRKVSEVLLCSLFGVVIATVVEFASSPGGDESRFHLIRNAIGNFFETEASFQGAGANIITLLFLYLLTLFFCHLLDANSKRNSFMLGVGILSFIFNICNLQIDSDSISSGTNLNRHNNKVTKVTYLLKESVLVGQSLFPLNVVLKGKSENEPARVFIRQQNGSLSLKRILTSNEFQFSVPEGIYQIIVEVEGYQIMDRRVQISQPEQINIELVESNIPLGIQRIRRGILH